MTKFNEYRQQNSKFQKQCIQYYQPTGYYLKVVTWSSDGNYLAFGSVDGTIRVIDLNKSIEIFRLQDHLYGNAVCFDHRVSRLATDESSHNILIWDLVTGRKIKKLEGHTRHVISLCFTSDDQYSDEI